MATRAQKTQLTPLHPAQRGGSESKNVRVAQMRFLTLRTPEEAREETDAQASPVSRSDLRTESSQCIYRHQIINGTTGSRELMLSGEK